MQKSFLILLVIPILFIPIVLAVNPFESEDSTDTQLDDLKIKLDRMVNAYNNLILNFEKQMPDPIDYSYNMELGWMDNIKKQQWCDVTQDFLIKDQLIFNEFSEAVNDISNESNIPDGILKQIIEFNDKHIPSMEEHQRFGDKMLIDFECE